MTAAILAGFAPAVLCGDPLAALIPYVDLTLAFSGRPHLGLLVSAYLIVAGAQNYRAGDQPDPELVRLRARVAELEAPGRWAA